MFAHMCDISRTHVQYEPQAQHRLTGISRQSEGLGHVQRHVRSLSGCRGLPTKAHEAPGILLYSEPAPRRPDARQTKTHAEASMGLDRSDHLGYRLSA